MGKNDAGGIRDAKNPRESDAGGADRLSDLPDDVRLLILARLRSTPDAARTSILSNSWRGLWTRVPQLHLCDVTPDDIDAVLAQVTTQDIVVDDVIIRVSEKHRVSASRISSWLGSAATLSLASPRKGDRSILLPSLDRAVQFSLHLEGTEAPLEHVSGRFPWLEELSLSGIRFEGGTLLPSCPRLQMLNLLGTLDIIDVASKSLIELELLTDGSLQRLVVDAPNLKQVYLSSIAIEMDVSPTGSLFAPSVEKLSWSCWIRLGEIAVTQLRRLKELPILGIVSHGDYTDNGDLELLLQNFSGQRVDRMSLFIDFPRVIEEMSENLIYAIKDLPVVKVLNLDLIHEGHSIGPAICHILKQCTKVQELNLTVLTSLFKMEEACGQPCPCHEPEIWASDVFCLPALQSITIYNISGSDHEVEFLKVVAKRSPMLHSVFVLLSKEAQSLEKKWNHVMNIFEGPTIAKCCIYDWEGNLIT